MRSENKIQNKGKNDLKYQMEKNELNELEILTPKVKKRREVEQQRKEQKKREREIEQQREKERNERIKKEFEESKKKEIEKSSLVILLNDIISGNEQKIPDMKQNKSFDVNVVFLGEKGTGRSSIIEKRFKHKIYDGYELLGRIIYKKHEQSFSKQAYHSK